MHQWFFVIALALASLSCASSGKRPDSAQLRSTIHELQSSVRTDRAKMRDLEYEIARLETELRDKPEVRPETREEIHVPELPVQVLEPLRDGAVSHEEDEDRVGSNDDDRVEIVYVGNAARDTSVQPDTSYLRQDRQRQRTGHPVSRQPEPARRARAPAQREPDERLPITDDAGPTVSQQLAKAGPPVARGGSTVARGVADKPPKDTPKAQYRRYLEALRSGNHAFAIAGFRNFIDRYPSHQLADNARYWLAEAYYDQRQYRVALEEFRKVRRDYPMGNKVPDSLLKIGFCHILLEDLDSARAILRELIRVHPRSKPAELAAQRLAALDDDTE